MRLRPLYHHYHCLFGERARDGWSPVHYPPGSHLGRPCPPIPLHRTLKEGHAEGDGEECEEYDS